MQRTSHFNFPVAVICKSNLNRSISAHCRLKRLGYNVSSYGTGQYTILPSPIKTKTHKFNFGESYRDIKAKLPKDEINVDFFRKNRIYQMLDRNADLKNAPEKFQESRKEHILIFTLDSTVYMDVLEYFDSRIPETGNICYVFNINVTDSLDAAEKGALDVTKFLEMLEADTDWENNIDKVVRQFCLSTKS
ncbi:RNA polymerase II subunit A C-terminal domain phosphatase SSU72 [Entamoeba marina]